MSRAQRGGGDPGRVGADATSIDRAARDDPRVRGWRGYLRLRSLRLVAADQVLVVALGGAVVAPDLVVRAAAALAIDPEGVDALPLGCLEAAPVVGDARDLRRDLDLADTPQTWKRSGASGSAAGGSGGGVVLCSGAGAGAGAGSGATRVARQTGSPAGGGGLSRARGGLSRSSQSLRVTAGLT